MQLKEVIAQYPDFQMEVEKRVRELLSSKPDFRYCTNLVGFCHYNGPSRDSSGNLCGPECNGCVFGQALQSMGWGGWELNQVRNIAEIFDGTGFVVPRVWSVVQFIQDSKTWGEALYFLDNPSDE